AGRSASRVPSYRYLGPCCWSSTEVSVFFPMGVSACAKENGGNCVRGVFMGLERLAHGCRIRPSRARSAYLRAAHAAQRSKRPLCPAYSAALRARLGLLQRSKRPLCPAYSAALRAPPGLL